MGDTMKKIICIFCSLLLSCSLFADIVLCRQKTTVPIIIPARQSAAEKIHRHRNRQIAAASGFTQHFRRHHSQRQSDFTVPAELEFADNLPAVIPVSKKRPRLFPQPFRFMQALRTDRKNRIILPAAPGTAPVSGKEFQLFQTLRTNPAAGNGKLLASAQTASVK